MKNSLSFYIPRSSALHKLNPLTKLVMVFTFIILAFFGPGTFLPTALILFAIIPVSFIGQVQREYLSAAARLLFPVVGFLFVMQSIFLPYEGRQLFSFWVLDVTTESVKYAFITATRIYVMVSSFILLLLSTHPSELMSDLTRRGLSGSFAYVITSTLQIIPQMQNKANTIIDAQKSRGLDTEGNMFKRAGALLPLVGPLVFGSLVDVEERAIAIEARAFTAKLKKTFLREIPDTGFDKAARWVFLVLIILAFGSKLWL
ncbi:MAG: energy-coupling factor transporter transmembrane protein EcfT [Anaerolineales bacterium]|nr:energy-coupling factor transporter transmembrane protein EcfT [Anaerolineales bacterium]